MTLDSHKISSQKMKKVKARTGTSISPLHRKLIKSIKAKMSFEDSDYRKLMIEGIYFYFQSTCQLKRSRKSYSKEALSFFVSKLKDFMGIDLLNEEREPVQIIGFSEMEVQTVRLLEACINTNNNPEDFLSSATNRSRLLELIVRDDVEAHFCSDTTDSSARDSSSAGSSNDP